MSPPLPKFVLRWRWKHRPEVDSYIVYGNTLDEVAAKVSDYGWHRDRRAEFLGVYELTNERGGWIGGTDDKRVVLCQEADLRDDGGCPDAS